MAWDMWQHCNDALHNSPKNQEEILDAEINQDLQELYDQEPQALKDVLQLQKHSADQLKQFPTAYKHQWLETVKLVQA